MFIVCYDCLGLTKAVLLFARSIIGGILPFGTRITLRTSRPGRMTEMLLSTEIGLAYIHFILWACPSWLISLENGAATALEMVLKVSPSHLGVQSKALLTSVYFTK